MEMNRERVRRMKAFSNGYKVSYSFIKDFAKDKRNRRCIVDCMFLLQQSEAAW